MSALFLCPIILATCRTSLSPCIAFRAFKTERILEVWGASKDSGPYHLLETYPIAAMSGGLGPKRIEGDLQVPEGFYRINRFNPQSQFHLSLGLNYPNSSDRKLSDPRHPGADIFIHGNHVSAGCLAMTDPVIDVIYKQASYARDRGQRNIPVTIFPFRMTQGNWSRMSASYSNQPGMVRFWETLRTAYDRFESNHFWPRPHVNRYGYYVWPRARRGR